MTIIKKKNNKHNQTTKTQLNQISKGNKLKTKSNTPKPWQAQSIIYINPSLDAWWDPSRFSLRIRLWGTKNKKQLISSVVKS